MRTEGPTLFVANHVSYLDIPVIAQCVDATFVAKAEVAGWPLFGHAAKLTRTIFIQRSAPKRERKAGRCWTGWPPARIHVVRGGHQHRRLGGRAVQIVVVRHRREPASRHRLAVQPVSISYTRALMESRWSDAGGSSIAGSARRRCFPTCGEW